MREELTQRQMKLSKDGPWTRLPRTGESVLVSNIVFRFVKVYIWARTVQNLAV
jgi:hypothetical protein